jgi:adenylate cyclase
VHPTEPLVRNVLRIIQDVVTGSKGTPLHREEIRRIEEALKSLAGTEVPLAADTQYSKREASILFADLRGFSTIAASYPPPVVLGVLSRCFGRMTEIVLRHYGTIDKFMGDAIMAVFHGDPQSPRDHARRAVLCAVEMQLAMYELRSEQRDEGLPEIYLGIGISTGEVMAGLIGSDAYRAYTVIGEEVNLAARLEALSLRGQVLMSEATYQHCQDFVQAGEAVEVHVKGRQELLRIREALGVPSLGRMVPRQDQRKSPRVDTALGVECRPVSGKMVGAHALRGRIRDLGYYGARLELLESLPLYSELKLAFELRCIAYRADDVYARVVSMRQQHGTHYVGLEFTSAGPETNRKLHLYVHMRLQGECAEDLVPLPA